MIGVPSSDACSTRASQSIVDRVDSTRDLIASNSVRASKIDIIDNMVDGADRELWVSFQGWLEANSSPWVTCHFHEQLNNQAGILMFCVSRNHRPSPVWDMLTWIASNGPGSYGLFFVNDDEDFHDAAEGPQRSSRFTPPVTYDFTNVFRVHRISNG